MTSTAPGRGLEILPSAGLAGWLAAAGSSLAFSTYQIGKFFLIGVDDVGGLSIFERTFNRAMGLAVDGESIWMSSRYQIWKLQNTLAAGTTYQGYDRLYVPRVGFTTGDVDTHDLAVEADGRVLFVNTAFNCIATLSDTHSFKPVWRPPFVSALVGEDRCHLNGLCLVKGKARFATVVAQTDTHNGWREHRADGGCVIDVQSNEIITTGLSMPHSPRWHAGRLWLLNAGTGDFGYVDPTSGEFVPIAFCTGFARGVAFIDHYAVIGLSKPRDKSFSGLPLDHALTERNLTAKCGLQVVDLRDGSTVHTLHLEGLAQELYDVAALPGVHRPMALGFKTDEIARMLAIEPVL